MDSSFPWGGMSDCSFTQYSANNAGSYDLWYGARSFWKGFSGVKGEVVDVDGEAPYQTMPDFNDKKLPFNVLATDYENYLVMYSCSTSFIGSFDVTSIYSRENIPLEKGLLLKAIDDIKATVGSFYPYDDQNHLISDHPNTCTYEKAGKWAPKD
jgi:hypothetical protein